MEGRREDSWGCAIIPQGNHITLDESVAEIEVLGAAIGFVGEKSDAGESAFAGEVHGVMEEACSVAMAAVFVVDDEIFEEEDEAALGGADGDE